LFFDHLDLEIMIESSGFYIFSKQEPVSGKVSPLDFLAQASMDAGQSSNSKWIPTASEGKERITVVQGPTGTPPIRLHKGSGKLPQSVEPKSITKKCRNRECQNMGGQVGKPRSIYCSKRCQSREQNLRQGRIKNVKSPNTIEKEKLGLGSNNANNQNMNRTDYNSDESSDSSPNVNYSSNHINQSIPHLEKIEKPTKKES